MRLLKKIIAILSFIVVLFVVGCTNSKEINISGSMDIDVYKTSITIETTFVDSEDGLLAKEKAKINIIVLDNEQAEITRKNVTIKVNGETGEITSTAVDVSSLEADTEYTVKLMASLDGSQKVLEAKTVKTINNGESIEDPIIIETKADFEAMSKEPSAFYKLNADLDYNGEELSAIFNASNKFTGHLDGNGHTISNFDLDVDTTYSGIFGYIKGATITNLKIKGATFDANRGERYIGALAGYAVNSTISNVTIEDIYVKYEGQTSKTFMVGGLVGYAEKTTIENVSVTGLEYNMGKARLKAYVGGLVGHNVNSSINNSSVVGVMNVTIGYTSNSNGLAFIGGFVGLNDSAKGVNSCYAKVNLNVNEIDEYSGNKTHKTFVGGFIGGNSTTVCKVNDCAAIGDITVSVKRSYTVYVGGFVGRFVAGSSAVNCVYKPVENGVTITLMGEDGTKEEDVTVQKAYVGLVVGYTDSQSKLNNVFAYADKFVCTPASATTNQIVVSDSLVSTDLSLLSDTIKNLIQ